MPLLNYTTTIAAAKTVAEIQGILQKHGAKAVLIEYGTGGEIEALSFNVETPHGERAFRLPVESEAVMRVFARQHLSPRFCNKPQALRVAWRIIKDWVAAQMAILETEMVKMEQVFLPYMITPSGHTLYESLVERHLLLTSGDKRDTSGE